MADNGGKSSQASTSEPTQSSTSTAAHSSSLIPPATTSSSTSFDAPPPSYASSTDTAAADITGASSSSSSDVLPPATLLLAGTQIFASNDPNSPPLYELSYPIGHLRESNTTVELSRIDYRVRNATSAPDRHPIGSGPQVASRGKHIFNLRRPATITGPSFAYSLDSVSRGNLGHVGLKTHRGFGSSGYRAWRAARPREGADLEARDLLFAVKDCGKGRHDWRDGNDKNTLLAFDTAQDGIYRLQVVVPLNRAKRDALVATWCLRLWWEIALSKVEPRSWDEAKRILQTRTGDFPMGTSYGVI